MIGGFEFGQTDKQTDIGGCRVAFATEKCTFCFSIVLNQFDMEYWCLACLGYETLCKAKFRMFDK